MRGEKLVTRILPVDPQGASVKFPTVYVEEPGTEYARLLKMNRVQAAAKSSQGVFYMVYDFIN